MQIIELKQAINVNGKDVTEVTLDFDQIRGKDLIAAEKEVRQLGDTSPTVFLSMNFQAVIAAKLIGVPVEDLYAANATDFKKYYYGGGKFFASLGVKSSRAIKELALNLAMATYTPITFYLDLNMDELAEYATLANKKTAQKNEQLN